MNQSRISLRRKRALSEALKQLMRKKPLSRITVNELLEACDISRNTFYYHFQDIYDLLRWTLEQESLDVLKKMNLLINTEEALRFIVNYVEENRRILLSAYNSLGYDEMKRFFYPDLYAIVNGVVEQSEASRTVALPQKEKDFISMFFCEACASSLINYLHAPDRWSKEEVIRYLTDIFRGFLRQLRAG